MSSNDINFIIQSIDTSIKDLLDLHFYDEVNIDITCKNEIEQILERAKTEINASYISFRKRCNLPLI